MRTILMALALAGSCLTLAAAQTSGPEPVCKADQAGNVLLTTIQYDDGYRVDGPWRIHTTNKRRGVTRLTATLDHIVETDPLTRKRQLTPLPDAIELTFEGASAPQLMRHAAEVWCATVSRAVAARPTQTLQRLSENRQVI